MKSLMAIAVSKQVEGLHKASGLELLKPQGAQAGGLCSLGTVFPMPHRPIGLYAMGLSQFKAAGLVKVSDLFCRMKNSTGHAILQKS